MSMVTANRRKATNASKINQEQNADEYGADDPALSPKAEVLPVRLR